MGRCKNSVATPLEDLEGGLRGLSASQYLALKCRNQALRICRRCRAEGFCSLSFPRSQSGWQWQRWLQVQYQRRAALSCCEPSRAGCSLKPQHGQGAGRWVGSCAAVPKSAGGQLWWCAYGSVLCWTGLGVAFAGGAGGECAEKSRGLFLVRVFTS